MNAKLYKINSAKMFKREEAISHQIRCGSYRPIGIYQRIDGGRNSSAPEQSVLLQPLCRRLTVVRRRRRCRGGRQQVSEVGRKTGGQLVAAVRSVFPRQTAVLPGHRRRLLARTAHQT